MLHISRSLTNLLGSGGWLSVFLLAIAILLLCTQLATAQQGSTDPPLSAPTLTALAGENKVDLSWTEVTDAARYELWTWTSKDGYQRLDDGSLTDNAFDHIDVIAETTYYYWVRAVSVSGEKSDWSERQHATTAGADPTTTPTSMAAALDRPILTAVYSPNAIELSWGPVFGATRYILWAWTFTTGWQRLDDGALAATSYSHSGVEVGTTYYYAVRAVNARGETSDWSDYASLSWETNITPLTPTATPTFTETPAITPPSTITATPTITLTPPPGGTTVPTTTATPTTIAAVTSTPTATPSDRQPGENIPATGAPTLSGTPRVCERLTADLSNISDEDGLENVEFRLQWFARDESIELGKGGWIRSISWFNPNEDGLRQRQFTIGSRDEGFPMYVRVHFYDDEGNSEWLHSSQTSVVVAASNPTRPNAPGQVEVTPGESGKLSVSWHGPAPISCRDGGSIVTEFKVQWKLATGDWNTSEDVSEATIIVDGDWSESYAISGLTNGVEYTVRVIATNAIGDSSPSSVITATPQDSATQ